MNACQAAGEAVLMCLEDAGGDVSTARTQSSHFGLLRLGHLLACRAELSPTALLGEFIKPVSAKQQL